MPHDQSEPATARWEDEGGHIQRPESMAVDERRRELERYGISTVKLTVFDWGGYRYTNATDAIAAAKRSRR